MHIENKVFWSRVYHHLLVCNQVRNKFWFVVNRVVPWIRVIEVNMLQLNGLGFVGHDYSRQGFEHLGRSSNTDHRNALPKNISEISAYLREKMAD